VQLGWLLQHEATADAQEGQQPKSKKGQQQQPPYIVISYSIGRDN
jgi:hypothetical protein